MLHLNMFELNQLMHMSALQWQRRHLDVVQASPHSLQGMWVVTWMGGQAPASTSVSPNVKDPKL